MAMGSNSECRQPRERFGMAAAPRYRPPNYGAMLQAIPAQGPLVPRPARVLLPSGRTGVPICILPCAGLSSFPHLGRSPPTGADHWWLPTSLGPSRGAYTPVWSCYVVSSFFLLFLHGEFRSTVTVFLTVFHSASFGHRSAGYSTMILEVTTDLDIWGACCASCGWIGLCDVQFVVCIVSCVLYGRQLNCRCSSSSSCCCCCNLHGSGGF